MKVTKIEKVICASKKEYTMGFEIELYKEDLEIDEDNVNVTIHTQSRNEADKFTVNRHYEIQINEIEN